MSVVDLSSRDPIFFLHHANVDRLWAAWNRRGNANSPEPMWRDFAFNRNFVNPDGSPWNVAVGELGSPPALGYRYDDDDGPFAADLVRADRRSDDRKAARLPPARSRARWRARAPACAASNCRPAARSRSRSPRTTRSRRATGRSQSPCRSAVRSARSSARRRFAFRPDRPDAEAIPALRLGGAARHRAAARRHHPCAGVLQLPRALAAHAARRSELCDERQLLRRRAREPRRRRACGAARRCRSMSISRRRSPAWTIRAACAPTG